MQVSYTRWLGLTVSLTGSRISWEIHYISWDEKTHPLWEAPFPLGSWDIYVKKGKWTARMHTLLVVSDRGWRVTDSFKLPLSWCPCHDGLHLELWTKINFSFPKLLFVREFYPSNQKGIQDTVLLHPFPLQSKSFMKELNRNWMSSVISHQQCTFHIPMASEKHW